MSAVIRAVRPPTRRIDGQVYDARVEAARIVSEARSVASELLRAAEREADAIRADARAAGLEEASVTARGLLAGAAAERARILASIEPDLVRSALAIAGRVLRREAERSTEVAVDMARRALCEAGDSAPIAVRIHPEELDAVRARHLDAPRATGIAWLADPSVGRGGAVVETASGAIDARLESQLEVVERALAGAVR